MRELVWRFCLVCGVLSLCATSSWAAPTFSLVVTGVYEQEFDGGLGEWVWISKCDPLICPDQDLPRVCSAQPSRRCVTNDDCVGVGNCISIAGPGDFISIEVYLENWDPDPNVGVCNDRNQTPGCTVGNDATCPNRHCSLTGSPCDDDGDCNFPSRCVDDRCLADPLVSTIQWTFDASSFFNYPDPGPNPGLKHAEISCLSDEDCACSFDLSCSGGPITQCTCEQACEADDTCPDGSTVYFDFGRPDWLFVNLNALMSVNTLTPNRQAGASLLGTSGVPEYNPGPPPRESPYYVGTLVLQVAEQNNCGTFLIDFVDTAAKTFVQDSNALSLPGLVTSPATISLIDFCVEEDKVCNQPAPVCFKQWCNPCTALCEEHPDVGASCDDGDPCTVQDSCDESGQCSARAKVCGLGEYCEEGTGDCLPGGCTLPDDIVSVTPAACAIDGRQPHSPANDFDREGWNQWVFQYVDSCLPRSLDLRPADFTLTEDPFGTPPLITQVVANDFAHTMTVRLDQPIDTAKWTCLTLVDPDDPDVEYGPWCMGHLPGDVNGNRTSDGADIDALINHLDGIIELPEYGTDVNRSGVRTDGADLLRLIDLLNGAMAYDPWMGQTLPRCTSP